MDNPHRLRWLVGGLFFLSVLAACGSVPTTQQSTPPNAASLPVSPSTLVTNAPTTMLAITPTSTTAAMADASCSDVTYASKGAPIRAILCQPTGNATDLPAIIYLHGSGGSSELPPPGVPADPELKPMPVGVYRDLAAKGFVAMGIAYFSQTPAPGADPDNFDTASDQDLFKNVPTWLRVIDDGVMFLQSQPRVAHDRIGVVGWSLGAHLALLSASQNPAYRAVVVISGFADTTFSTQATKLPPTLLLHGDADDVVPVARAYAVRDALKATGRTVELKIASGGNHFWAGQQGRDGFAQLLAFLQKNL